MFIKVTNFDGKTAYINTDRIHCIESHSQRGYMDASRISFANGDYVLTSESPDMIMKLIERSKNEAERLEYRPHYEPQNCRCEIKY